MSKEKFSYVQTPIENKVFTMTDISRIIGASADVIHTIIETINAESSVNENGRIVYDFKTMKQIMGVYKNTLKVSEVKKTNTTVKTIEELRAEHPLVKDDRFFKLSYFPKTEPACFENDN